MKTKKRMVGHVGDVNWLEYGGGPIYRPQEKGQLGLYEQGEWLEYVEPPEEDTRGGKYTVYRVDLDRGVPSWGSLKDVASSSGRSVRELEEDFGSADARIRAGAYQDWAGHYGWHEFDNYPLELSKTEINRRYPKPRHRKSR
ncbi:MAG: hypothetical protein ACYDH4_11335 [Candidatus Cryosericum sp.]